MNVEIRHLRCLIALAGTGSFTDAAIELGVSQASISRNLAGLNAPALPVYAAWPKSRQPGEAGAIVKLLTELYS